MIKFPFNTKSIIWDLPKKNMSFKDSFVDLKRSFKKINYINAFFRTTEICYFNSLSSSFHSSMADTAMDEWKLELNSWSFHEVQNHVMIVFPLDIIEINEIFLINVFVLKFESFSCVYICVFVHMYIMYVCVFYFNYIMTRVKK